jgi:hypothetical protein
VGKKWLFWFCEGSACGWGKPNVPFVRLAKIVFKKCAVGKNKNTEALAFGRLSDGSFAPSLYVYFCRSFLLCRLLGLQVTFRVLPKAGRFSTTVDLKN